MAVFSEVFPQFSMVFPEFSAPFPEFTGNHTPFVFLLPQIISRKREKGSDQPHTLPRYVPWPVYL